MHNSTQTPDSTQTPNNIQTHNNTQTHNDTQKHNNTQTQNNSLLLTRIKDEEVEELDEVMEGKGELLDSGCDLFSGESFISSHHPVYW